MKTINQLIIEAKKTNNVAYQYLYKTYYKSELTKDQIRKTLEWFKDDMNICKEFEDYLTSIDTGSTAWTFFPESDAFLDKKEYDNILDRLADYLFTLAK